VPLRPGLVGLPNGAVTCEITDMFFVASTPNAKAHLTNTGSAWHAWPGSGGNADGQAEEMALVQGAVNSSTSAYADELNNRPERRPHRL
jgi:hypothetical protein